MKSIFLVFFIIMIFSQKQDFKADQLQNSRVREAYNLKQKSFSNTLKNHGIDPKSLKIFIRVFKKEKVLELWAMGKNKKFEFLKGFEICALSGNLGPKRAQGDDQTPEGFYYISRFNPNSNFYLSLGINYPNRSDRILSNAENLGGDIFIHGNCVTIGCIPITDDKIKELYLYAVEAKNCGQDHIPVHIFPTKLTDDNLAPVHFNRILYYHTAVWIARKSYSLDLSRYCRHNRENRLFFRRFSRF